MSVNPKITFWLGVWTSLLLGLANGSGHLPSFIPQGIAGDIISACAFFGWINTMLLTALSGYSSTQPGPLVSAAPKPPARSGAGALVLFLGLAVAGTLALLVMPAMAMAQTPQAMHVPIPRPAHHRHVVQHVVQHNVVDVAQHKVVTTSPGARAAKALTTAQVQQNPLLLLQQFSLSDLQAALADANAQSPADTIAANCYSALIALIQSPTFALPTGGVSGVFTALQKARDIKAQLANLASPTGPLANLNASCAAYTQDNLTTLIALGGAVGLISNPAGATAAVGTLGAQIAAFLAAFPK